jgi:pimeloyl-ACP methyl ester carboxylesterase
MTSSSKRPAIVFVHGAWHRPLHYINLITTLEDEGYTLSVPILPSAGWDDAISEVALTDDVKAIRQSIKPHLENGEDIVIVCHSYGGLPATDSVIGETIEERAARGEKGGIKALVYISSFASPAAGLSLFNLIGLKDEAEHPDWWYIKVRKRQPALCVGKIFWVVSRPPIYLKLTYIIERMCAIE